MAKYAYKNNKVKYIYVEKVTDFITQWNKIPAERIINIHLFLHGQPGSLCFRDGELIYDSSLASKNTRYFSELKKLKPTGKVYLFSCNGGTFYKVKSKYSSVAQVLSTKTNGKTVRAAVNDSVNYFRWYAPSSCKPVLAYNEGYWADFNCKVVRNRIVSSCVSIGREWYL